jgi:hypothetical protein
MGTVVMGGCEREGVNVAPGRRAHLGLLLAHDRAMVGIQLARQLHARRERHLVQRHTQPAQQPITQLLELRTTQLELHAAARRTASAAQCTASTSVVARTAFLALVSAARVTLATGVGRLTSLLALVSTQLSTQMQLGGFDDGEALLGVLER